jgi:hypothetical protein
MTGRIIGQQHQLVSALGQRDEQREKNRTDEQPMADDDIEHNGARHRAHHESYGNRQHIDDDDVFQRARVEGLKPDVSGGENAEPQPEHERRGDGDRTNDRCGAERDGNR